MLLTAPKQSPCLILAIVDNYLFMLAQVVCILCPNVNLISDLFEFRIVHLYSVHVLQYNW